MPLPKSATARRWPSKATGWQYWCAAASVTQSCAAASASGIGPMINLSSAAGLAVLACGDHRIEVIEQARIVVLGRMPERSQAFEIRGAADIDAQSGGWKRLGRGRTRRVRNRSPFGGLAALGFLAPARRHAGLGGRHRDPRRGGGRHGRRRPARRRVGTRRAGCRTARHWRFGPPCRRGIDCGLVRLRGRRRTGAFDRSRDVVVAAFKPGDAAGQLVAVGSEGAHSFRQPPRLLGIAHRLCPQIGQYSALLRRLGVAGLWPNRLTQGDRRGRPMSRIGRDDRNEEGHTGKGAPDHQSP